MNKKQRNRKEVLKNKRNRIINRRYSSTIKTLLKRFFEEIKLLNDKTILNTPLFVEKKEKLRILQNALFSIIDKAQKKSVIHKNNAAKKKSRISNLSNQFSHQ